jgi:(E)-4-hydroxy-3-methylbut-2-enyl-diphosphate synthase
MPKVAVMGCAVNGPGEAKGADVALCGGDEEFVVYVKGSQVCKVGQKDAVGKVMEYVVSF